MLTPEIAVDAEIDFAITPKLIRILKQFEPYGPQNMTPVFLTKNIKDTGYGKPMGQEDEHLKLLSNKITPKALLQLVLIWVTKSN
jgi:single-stranded-DNA-specific exonuclease